MKTENQPPLVSDTPPEISHHKEIVFRNASIVNPDGTISKDMDIFCKEGKIFKIGKNLKGISAFSKNVSGKWVIPSIFNTHCHMQLNMPSMLMNISDLKHMKTSASKQQMQQLADMFSLGIFNVRDAVTNDISDNEYLLSRAALLPFGNIFIHRSVAVSMLGSCWTPKISFRDKLIKKFAGIKTLAYDNSLSGAVVFSPDSTPSQVRDAVNIAIDERGAEYIKIYEQRHKLVDFKPGIPLMTLSQLETITDQARKRGIRTMMHHFSLESFQRGILAGVDTFSHIVIDELIPDKDLLNFSRLNCTIEPTLSLAFSLSHWRPNGKINTNRNLARLDKFRNKEFDKMTDSFWVEDLREAVKRGFDRIKRNQFTLFGLKNMTAPFEFHETILTTGVENLNNLISAGATISTGNDGGIPPLPPSALWYEMALLELFTDIPQDQKGIFILNASTLNGAKALGLDESMGSISQGKKASMIFLNKNPLKYPEIIGRLPELIFNYDIMGVNPITVPENLT
ncbi:MAG: amidohydrolase family protein [Deltaproteobacteria bacterium]|nr:amidohydrolase family protein [Deltaproteobacteria bacterium]